MRKSQKAVGAVRAKQVSPTDARGAKPASEAPLTKHAQAVHPALARVVRHKMRRDLADRTDTSADFSRLASQLKATGKRLGDTVDCWEDLAPPELRRSVVVESFVGGVLQLVVADSPTAYALDRALRAGLESALRKATKGKLIRIKAKLGSPDGRARL